MTNKVTVKYSNELRNSIYNDILNGLTYKELSLKYNMLVNTVTWLLYNERKRRNIVNYKRLIINYIEIEITRLLNNGMTVNEIYEYFTIVKPQFKLKRYYILRKVRSIKNN
jgi:orotate phosphoribosyltransferase-like protein